MTQDQGDLGAGRGCGILSPVNILLIDRMYHGDTFMAMREPTRPMSPRQATEFIRSKVGPHLDIALTKHCKERLQERGLIMGDVLHVLKHGFVFEEGEESTQAGFYKYQMECATPNSGGRTVVVVVIPYPSPLVKLVTVMWKVK
jgi:Domain of unknown function (DUF4258)